MGANGNPSLFFFSFFCTKRKRLFTEMGLLVEREKSSGLEHGVLQDATRSSFSHSLSLSPETFLVKRGLTIESVD